MRIFNLKFTLLFFLFAFSYTISHASNRPKAPLYWSAYEYSYEASSNQMGGGAIPENIWKANIDWVAENLLPYGYNIICIDGWGDDASINENGYRTKHASGVGESGDVNWEYDYAYWSQYIQSKGMTLGIYNNPLWVNVRASDLPIKGREDLKVGSLINEDEDAMWFKWVQVERPGAEEYVKNYIRYYADMGVSYLRVDFLSWFEDGKDKLPSLSTNINRPKEYYQTALRWMKEACDESGMILSLVMPHLYNDAESEILSAPNSLIRINEDICDGGWYRLSEIERGISHSIWSKYHNMFDGFVYWSKVSDKMILDGDFTRLNTFDTDAEKKTAISLQLMAGGPIAVADQYNTIGENLGYYQNEEILQLNKDRFVGKPLSNNPLDINSQIWKGQLSNGNWIVGLFNRENNYESRSIDFQTEFGFQEADIQDLWDSNTKWTSSFISENIEPHGCRIYRVSEIFDEMYVGGTFNNWTLSHGTMMKINNNIWQINNVYIEQGEHELKFANKSDYSGNDWGITQGLNGVAKLSTGGKSNIKFNIEKSDNYSITFNSNSKEYSISNITTSTETNEFLDINIYFDIKNNKVNVSSKENGLVNILSLSGTSILQKIKRLDSMELDLSFLQNGVYVLKFENEKTVITKKILISNL